MASKGAAKTSKNDNVQVDFHSSDYQERPPKIPKGSVGTSGSSSPENFSSKSGSYHRKESPSFTCLFSVACLYVQFTQSGKQSLGTYYAIYLAARTSLNLKVEFAAKLQIDPCVITRIVWVNSKGLKVVVDDDVVGQLPEAQIMIARILEDLYTERAPLRAERSEVEVELVF
ncbi:MAG: hypothetical protein LBE67_18810 [Kocuria palustris]|nr:hypothetical protein [Kocuria palustris]